MTTVRQARLTEVELPDFGRPATTPEIPPRHYAERLDRLRARMERRGYDQLVVYADREHSANLAYLTGFDPRFEEAILIVAPTGEPAVLVGNECYGMAGAAPLPMRRHRFQDLSLPSQPRDRSRPLAEILADEGVDAGKRVGVVGWKPYAERSMLDVPAFLADELRRIVGPGGVVENANDLLVDAADGLRVLNEVEQLAAMETAACTTSTGVRDLIHGLRPSGTARSVSGRPAARCTTSSSGASATRSSASS
jgi:Xaa-Pro aminopeptidase